MTLFDELVQTLMDRIDARSDSAARADAVLVWQRLLGKFAPPIGLVAEGKQK